MNEAKLFSSLLLAWFVLSGLIFVLLYFIPAPYGRLAKNGWGPSLPDRLGWMVMEAPAAIGFALFFASGKYQRSLPSWIFLGLWEFHYLYRAFLYPFHHRSRGRRIPVAVLSLGLIFNIGNSYLNGRYLFTFSGGYPFSWLWDSRFLGGVALFLSGMAINRQSDKILNKLRQSD